MDTEIILFTRKRSSGNSTQEYNSNPNIKVVHWNFTNYQLIEENILDSDCIINLCGILYENNDCLLRPNQELFHFLSCYLYVRLLNRCIVLRSPVM